jgi:hypothetical protein
MDIIMLSEISQVQKAKYCMFSHIAESRSKMMIVMITIMGHECERVMAGGII